MADVRSTTANLGLIKYSRGHPVTDTDLATNADLIDAAVDALGSGTGALTTGQIFVGAAGAAADVAMSGDVTIATGGATTIGAGAVDEAMLVVPSGDGLHASRVARATYDFSVDGGLISQIGLGVTLPDNAVVTRTTFQVLTTLTSATDAATISVDIPTDDVAGLRGATAISTATSWDAGWQEGIQDGTAAAYSVQCTAARELSITIAVEAVTAGKFIVFCEYVVSE